MCDSPFCSLGGKLCKDFLKYFLTLFLFYVCIKQYFTVSTRTALFMLDCLLLKNKWITSNGFSSNRDWTGYLSHHCKHSYFAKCIGSHSFQIIVHQSAFNHLQHETIITLILRFDLCISCLQTRILNALVFSWEGNSTGSMGWVNWGSAEKFKYTVFHQL